MKDTLEMEISSITLSSSEFQPRKSLTLRNTISLVSLLRTSYEPEDSATSPITGILPTRWNRSVPVN